MIYKYATFFKWIHIVVDYSILNLGLWVGYTFENPQVGWSEVPEFYNLHFLLLNLLWFYFSNIIGLYKSVMRSNAALYLQSTILALFIFLSASFTLAVILPQIKLTSDFLQLSSAFFSVFLLLWKGSFLLLRKHRRKFWIDYQRIVIVGEGQVGTDLYNYIQTKPELGYQVEGLFDEGLSQKVGEKKSAAYNLDDFFSFITAKGITEIYCALPSHCYHKIRALMQEADRRMVRFRLVPDIKGVFDRNYILELYGSLPILTNRNEPLENKANETMKRIFDIIFSSLVIFLLLSWLIPIIALIIRADSKGPIFFRQLRSGKDNKPFYCLKFRSMSVNSESDTKQASRGDARITRVGAFLRKTSLDELPQFFNVLKGEMSVVGPRPHMLKHTQDYSRVINNFMVRHFLTPGITGWAQVNGYRGETKETMAMSKRVEADLWYLENWSLILDLKIIFLTILLSVRKDKNAY